MDLHGSLLLFILMMLTVVDCLHPPSEDASQWEKFKVDFKRSYATKAEERLRFQNFVTNMADARQLNTKNQGRATFGITIFSDLSIAEFSEMNKDLPSHPRNGSQQHSEGKGCLFKCPSPKNSVDYRETLESVRNVKSQGTCGVCYIFAALGAIEAQMERKYKIYEPLSEQSVLDCIPSAKCKGGGFVHSVYRYAMKYGVLFDKQYHPYKEKKLRCDRSNAEKLKVTLKYFKEKDFTGNEKRMKEYIAENGPVTSEIFTRTKDFKNYKDGIIDTPECTKDSASTHAVLIVGYGSENGTDYWIVKNSHGPQWGDRGFFRIARNKNNMCNIGVYVTLPVIG